MHRSTCGVPRRYHLDDGRLVVAPFLPELRAADWWKNWMDRMQAAHHIRVALVPMFQPYTKRSDWASFCYGFSDWGDASPVANQQGWWRAARDVHALSVSVWMAPVCPGANIPSRWTYYDPVNTLLFRVMWNNAALGSFAPKGEKWDAADWVQMVTWNDYGEGTEIAPSTGEQYLFSDLTAYYVTMFKTGARPRIVRDVLYFCHRIQHTDIAYDTTKQPKPFTRPDPSTPAGNQIELLAFLKTPGVLQIQIDGKTQSRKAPAGITSFAVPLTPTTAGRPVFSLMRNGKTISRVTSPFAIVTSTTYQDLLYRGGSDTRARPTVVPASDALISRNGDSLQYSFNGTGIDFIAEKNRDTGSIEFSIDGGKQQTVSGFSPKPLPHQVVFSAGGLPFGVHTLKAVKKSGSDIRLEALKVRYQ